MKILNGITVDGARYRPPVERPKWRLVDYFLEAAEQHPGSDVLLWENGEITGWRNDTAKVARTNPHRKVRLSARHRFRELHDQSHNLRCMAREPGYFKTRAERAHALKTARMMRRHMYETPKTNPFRKLRPYKGGLTAAQLLDQAESRRESAALHRFSPTHRRHDLLWARTLRKKAYYTPKRRKKA